MLSGKGHWLSCFWVAPDTRRAEVKRKAAEPSDLDPLACGECLGHLLQQKVHHERYILPFKLSVLSGEEFDQLRLCHRARSP
jgi:hypothetical protein